MRKLRHKINILSYEQFRLIKLNIMESSDKSVFYSHYNFIINKKCLIQYLYQTFALNFRD